MEEGKLKITKTKKGYSGVLIKKDNKSISLNIPFKDDSLNEKVCEYELESGRPILIVCEEKEIFNANAHKKVTEPPKKSQQNPSKNSNQKPISYDAHSPYNFVRLNSVILPAEKIPEDFSIFDTIRNTGYIDIKISTKTPIFTRAGMTEKDRQEQMKNPEYKSPIFFQNGKGEYCIPGSSLRGMIRSVTEIISFSRLQFTQENRRLYFRSFADTYGSVRESYEKYMVSDKGKPKKMKSGILHRISYRKYEILPAGEIVKETNGFKPTKDYEAKKESDKNFLVHIKEIKGKSNYYRVKATGSPGIPLDYDTDIRNYLDDTNRSESVPNLVKDAEKQKYSPCFYVEYEVNGKKQIAFGHNPYFRFPYKKTVNEHIKQKPLPEGSFDIAESIFGIVHTDSNRKEETSIAGRVFFTDAILKKGSTLPKSKIKILSSPKPTSFQLYLEQKDSLKTYNDDTSIRGTKRYWNFPAKQWKLVESKNPEMETEITPLDSGSELESKIYFENLTDVELGVLLISIDPSKYSYHKLGMGKPYGLGSVKLSYSLHLSDIQNVIRH